MSVVCIFESSEVYRPFLLNPVNSALSSRPVLNPPATASWTKMLLSTQAVLEKERRQVVELWVPGKDFLKLLKWLLLHYCVFKADPWTLIDCGQLVTDTNPSLAWFPNSEEKPEGVTQIALCANDDVVCKAGDGALVRSCSCGTLVLSSAWAPILLPSTSPGFLRLAKHLLCMAWVCVCRAEAGGGAGDQGLGPHLCALHQCIRSSELGISRVALLPTVSLLC